MILQDRFFPRVWDGKKYWYPVYSELGITYECSELPLEEENIRNLSWALDWHLKDDKIEFNFLRPFGKSKKSKRKAMRKILLIVNDLFKTDEKE